MRRAEPTARAHAARRDRRRTGQLQAYRAAAGEPRPSNGAAGEEAHGRAARVRRARPAGPPGRATGRRRAGPDLRVAPGRGVGPPTIRHAGRMRRPSNKATFGSTSYDGADAGPFEPDWGGASWYGTTSGTYWTLNPKEYADPRKHGPEYQARARRSARARVGPRTATDETVAPGGDDRARKPMAGPSRPDPHDVVMVGLDGRASGHRGSRGPPARPTATASVPPRHQIHRADPRAASARPRPCRDGHRPGPDRRPVRGHHAGVRPGRSSAGSRSRSVSAGWSGS